MCSMATHGNTVRKHKEGDEAPTPCFAEATFFLRTQNHIFISASINTFPKRKRPPSCNWLEPVDSTAARSSPSTKAGQVSS